MKVLYVPVGGFLAACFGCGGDGVDPGQGDGGPIDARSDGSDAALDGPAPDGPVPRKIVFFTSTSYNGNLQSAGAGIDGLDGGDRLCQARATAAALTGTFKAWLSTSTVHALDHITGSGPWYNTGDKLVFANRAALQSSPPTEVGYDETGAINNFGYRAWTGTNEGGTRTGDTCNNWTNAATSPYFGQAGFPYAADSSWTQGTDFGCTVVSRLYCFQD